MRTSAATMKSLSSRPAHGRLSAQPRVGSIIGRIFDRLIKGAGSFVRLSDIGTNVQRSSALRYLRNHYDMDIRCSTRGSAREPLYSLVGINDGRAYIDLMVNPHLAKTFHRSPPSHAQ